MSLSGFAVHNFMYTSSDPLGSNYTSYTLMAWIYTSDVTTTQIILQREYSLNDASCIEFYISNSRLVVDDYQPSGGIYTSTGTVSINQWTHVALVRNSINPKRILYINGINAGQEDNSESYSGTTPNRIIIGLDRRNTINRYPFLGTIFDARVYSRSLSVTEISHIASSYGKDSIVGNLVMRTCIQDGTNGAAPSSFDLSPSKLTVTRFGTSVVVASDLYAGFSRFNGGI